MEGDAPQLLDPVADPARFLLRGIEAESEYVAALVDLVPGRDHVLPEPVRVVLLGDGPPERHDPLRRTEVVVKRDTANPGLALDETEYVRDRAAAPLVDRLVVVTDHTEVRTEPAQLLDQLFLNGVGVLILIDHDIPDVIPDMPDQRAGYLVVGLFGKE